MKKPTFALVGVSGYGRVHYDDIMRAVAAERADILCATVINQAEEAERCQTLRECGCTLFDNTDDMFHEYAGRIDVCFLPVGIGLHAPLAIAAMRAGMNVFVEKPLAATIQEADEIIATSLETGRFVAVGYQHMYQPPVQAAKRAIIEGRIGQLQTVRGIGLWPRTNLYYARNNWAGHLSAHGSWILDSPVNNALAHYLNLVCYLSGSAVDEMAQISMLQAGLYRANPSIENFDTAFLKMKTEANVNLFFVTSHVTASTMNPLIEAIGETGTIRITNETCVLTTDNGTSETTLMPVMEASRDHVMDAIFARLRDARAPVFTPLMASVVTRIVNAAHASTAIVAVPPASIDTVIGTNENEFRYVWKELDTLANQCFEAIRMPTTDDFPFCRNGNPCRPAELKRFDGPKLD